MKTADAAVASLTPNMEEILQTLSSYNHYYHLHELFHDERKVSQAIDAVQEDDLVEKAAILFL